MNKNISAAIEKIIAAPWLEAYFEFWEFVLYLILKTIIKKVVTFVVCVLLMFIEFK